MISPQDELMGEEEQYRIEGIWTVESAGFGLSAWAWGRVVPWLIVKDEALEDPALEMDGPFGLKSEQTFIYAHCAYISLQYVWCIVILSMGFMGCLGVDN